MLSKTPSQSPAMTFAFTVDRAVRLAVNLRCPHCARELRASDIEADEFGFVLICRGCDRDLLTVGTVS